MDNEVWLSLTEHRPESTVLDQTCLDYQKAFIKQGLFVLACGRRDAITDRLPDRLASTKLN